MHQPEAGRVQDPGREPNGRRHKEGIADRESDESEDQGHPVGQEFAVLFLMTQFYSKADSTVDSAFEGRAYLIQREHKAKPTKITHSCLPSSASASICSLFFW